MSWKDIPDTERDELLKLYEARALTSKHADQYGVDKLSSLKRSLRAWRQDRQSSARRLARQFEVDMPRQKLYDDYIVLDEDDVIITSDWEWPDTDPEMVHSVVLAGMRYNIKTLIIAGDLIAADHAAFNTWAETWAESGELNFDDEFGLLNAMLAKLAQWFEKIIITSGNHDERLQKKTGGHIHLGLFLKYANPDIQFSIYRKMYLRTRRGTYKITHPRNYSRMPVRLGQQLANVDAGPERDGEPVGVILGHTHHMQMGATENGMKEVVSLGCMRDPLKTKYKSLSDGNNPEWNQGWLMVSRGYFYPAWKQFTDWEVFLGDYAQYVPDLLDL